MDFLLHAFNRLTSWFNEPRNLRLVGYYHYHPASPYTHEEHIAAHKRTMEHAFNRLLYPQEIERIMSYRRTKVDLPTVLEDFFFNDVEQHSVPFDHHFENGLNAMLDAFRPPRPCLPAHLNDVEHHYPYKWQVNAEAPFATDSYFLDNRKKFSDFYDSTNHKWINYVDPVDMSRRYAHRIHMVLDQPTPPKFGFMKNAVFAWTRRWHHIIKSGFSDTAGLHPDDPYLSNRFIFPMLLHSKTAVVKKDDPNKMRTIWGCPKPWIIADTMFYWEYIAWIKLNPGITPMLWGYETFTGGWFRLNAQLFCSLIRKSFVTLDYSKFDKRAYFSVIRRIMLGIRTFLDFNSGYLPNINYPDTKSDWSPEKGLRLQRLWEWTLENLFHAPIVLPNGDMYVRNFAGIPSGLFTTQLLDSWYNYTMLATMLSAIGIDPRTCIIKVQGDDSVIRLAVLIPPQYHEAFLARLQELADLYFKSVISMEKSEVRNTLNGVEVLSYRNHNGLPHRDEIAMLAQMYHTKARNPTPEITMAQAIGFAYASIANHSRVLWVLQDIYNYYKSRGYSPNPAGLTLVFGNSPDRYLLQIPLDHFPTKSEIRKYLLSTHYENTAQNARTWPLSYFLHRPCE